MKNIADFFRTTILGGLLVLIPLLLFWVLLQEAIGTVVGIATPLADLIWQDTEAKVNFPLLLALMIITGASFLLGLLLRAPPGRRFLTWIEGNTVGRLPAFRMMKSLGSALLKASESTAFKPAMLVSSDGTREPAYLVEENDDGTCIVLLPWAPTPFAGSLKVVPIEMIQLLDTSLADYSAVLGSLGLGLSSQLKQHDVERPVIPGATRS